MGWFLMQRIRKLFSSEEMEVVITLETNYGEIVKMKGKLDNLYVWKRMNQDDVFEMSYLKN